MSQTAVLLQENNIIRSQLALKVFVVLLGGKRNVMAGDYLFSKPQTALRIAYRIINGEQGIPRIKVTIPEGIAVSDMANLLAKKLPNFDRLKFVKIAKPLEGYLFPDTYFFYENVSEEDIVKTMNDNFSRKIALFALSIRMSGRESEDIIKMASIVEKEATSTKDRRIIAGVLWKRIDDNYPLQVDPPFFYTLGKDSSEITMADLSSDSPYNLYKHKGLPPTPINNPGQGAIEDTLNPTITDYWYYLSDKRGNMHYATTHDGHIANREKYLQ